MITLKDHHSTIAAVATPLGAGGIGIIKLSGARAVNIAAAVFRKASVRPDSLVPYDTAPLPPSWFRSHRLYYGYIIDPDKKTVVDEVLLTVMRGPASYTGEDVVEINAHSGPVVLKTLLGMVLQYGAEAAAPGEFTKRAYLNGRIDLTQAEAVVDIIHAKTQKSLEAASYQLQGGMRQHIEGIIDSLKGVSAALEGAIDFPDELNDLFNPQQASDRLADGVLAEIKTLIERYETGALIKDGFKITVIGRPNVGKSSLMNRLIQKNRIIVTATPGTTRDLIEETVALSGFPVLLTDTAGIHDTRDPVETIGIEKTHQAVDRADGVLFLMDASMPYTSDDEAVFRSCRHKPVILVLNKSDLLGRDAFSAPPEPYHRLPYVYISALYNQGMDKLKDTITETCFSRAGGDIISGAVPNLRHRLLLEKSLEPLSSAVAGLKGRVPLDLVSMDIQEGLSLLSGILGDFNRPDVIDDIFSRFCIGK